MTQMTTVGYDQKMFIERQVTRHTHERETTSDDPQRQRDKGRDAHTTGHGPTQRIIVTTISLRPLTD
jgi:hypothetical protein